MPDADAVDPAVPRRAVIGAVADQVAATEATQMPDADAVDPAVLRRAAIGAAADQVAATEVTQMPDADAVDPAVLRPAVIGAVADQVVATEATRMPDADAVVPAVLRRAVVLAVLRLAAIADAADRVAGRVLGAAAHQDVQLGPGPRGLAAEADLPGLEAEAGPPGPDRAKGLLRPATQTEAFGTRRDGDRFKATRTSKESPSFPHGCTPDMNRRARMAGISNQDKTLKR
jgi:hypothetical protein